MNIKSKKGFTIIELIVVIAVLATLVLLGAPKLLGHVEKAQLARIQHDTKVMTTQMEIAMLANEINDFPYNDKSLSSLVAQKKLFEKEGIAKKVDATYISNNGVFKRNAYSRLIGENSNPAICIGGNLVQLSNLGVGGPADNAGGIFDNDLSDFKLDNTYKVIPDNYKVVIETRLKDTFYIL